MSLGVCLSLAAALNTAVFVPVQTFTLAWTHSIEKVRWEEDYAVVATTSPNHAAKLVALKARVRGSAAGMEPPNDAKLVNGWYVYTPTIHLPSMLRLTRSEFTADYDWCTQGHCQPMSKLLTSDGGVTLLSACDSDQTAARTIPTGEKSSASR